MPTHLLRNYCRATVMLLAFAGTALFSPVSISAADDVPCQAVIDPNNNFSFFLMGRNQSMLNLGVTAWGPDWKWTSVESTEKKLADHTLHVEAPVTIEGQTLALSMHVAPADARTYTFRYDLRAEKNIPLTMIAATLRVPDGAKGHVTLTDDAGKETAIDLPAEKTDQLAIKKAVFTGTIWPGPLTVTIDPPIQVSTDGEVRFQLATDLLKAGKSHATLTFTFPTEAALRATDSDASAASPVLPTADWFPYTPTWKPGNSVIGMEDWLENPAGKHGAVRIAGDRYEFEDHTPIKFWGVNLSYADSAPEKSNARFTAARFVRYGVNAVRMHKFTGADWAGIGDKNDATRFTPDGLDRLDYFASQLAQRGIYYGWSHTYQFCVRPGNRQSVIGYDELMKHGGNTYGVINWAEDVQDLLIMQVVNLLKHKNPYTGKAYAEDPALCYVELQNEDDIFFYTSDPAYKNFPTYRKLLENHFTEWLTQKYGSTESLARAWSGAVTSSDSLDNGTVTVQPNPWSMGTDGLAIVSGGHRQRMLDNAAFLHETQDRFYAKFVKAIRDAGYKGPLIGSPWQAPSMLPHYYNLRSDSLVGGIDRHDYFGEKFTDTMLHHPGRGLLSAGLQQVANRPFTLSEWIHVYPSLYSAEGPVIVAAYGLGLQGWDASYEFQSTSARPEDLVGKLPWGVWNADAPTQIGQYPVLARMIARGDVQEAPILTTRRISPDELATAKFNFADAVAPHDSVRAVAGLVPHESLAAGRTLVEFVEKSTPSTPPDLARYTQSNGQIIKSATGQLIWDAAAGFITIDTPGTQGYVGFAKDKTLSLGQLTITPACPYASILITALDRKSTLKDAKHVLLSVVARNANTGFRILGVDGKTITDNGRGPILLEPVKADIQFTGRHVLQVRILDHDGFPTDRTLPVQSDRFTLDGSKDHAMYYEITLE